VTALRIVGCVVAGAIALVALAFLLPWLKEGFDREELPLFASIAAGLGIVAGLWWLANRRGAPRLAAIGATLLALPFCVYAALSVRVLVNDWRGRRASRTVRILALRETEIRWPGLEGPVGVRLEVELEHAIGLEGNLFAPKILMGADPRPTYRDYFFGPMDQGVDAFLTVPGLERDQYPARDVFVRPGRVRMAFELFPSTMDRRDGNAVCFSAMVARPVFEGLSYEAGAHLGAAWFFAAPGTIYVDLSAPLTQALRRFSAFEGKADPWQAMMRRLEPERLRAAGYRACEPPRPGGGEACYCAPAAIQ
jgi:hypothetical protein